MFYWALLNIPAQYRYSQNAFQTLAVPPYKALKKYGCKKLLADFINTLNLMQSEGLEFVIHDKTGKLHGFLAFCLGNNPAQNWLGGFKESCGPNCV